MGKIWQVGENDLSPDNTRQPKGYNKFRWKELICMDKNLKTQTERGHTF